MEDYEAINREMDECIMSVPPRFRQAAEDVFEYRDPDMWTMRSVRKIWETFLEEVVPLMTEEERVEWRF